LAAPPQFHEYNPEYVKDYEIGIKTDFEFMGIKARDNLNAFYSSYNNIQAQINVEYTNAAGLLTDSSFILNGAQGVSKGIEDQFQVIPTEGLTLSGNLAIIDAHYTHYLSQILQPGFPEVNGVTDLSGAKFLIAPLLKYELNARYKLPLDGSFGDMFVSANYAWQQHVGLSISATPNNTLGSFATVDMTVDWKGVMGWSNIDASFSATNLLNNRWRDGENGLYNSFGVWGISVADPREFAVKLRYQFGSGSNSLF
jgi:iron complex outermembrane receptor protein